MKIDYAIVSSDDNPLYLEFWEIIKDLWINVIGIKPILVQICDENKISDYGSYIIHKIKKNNILTTGLQSQISRMFITKYYMNDVCLTSDIDMLPLSKKYFVDDISQYSNDKLLIMSSDAYTNVNRYPICYNAGKGKIFNDILNLDMSFDEYCLKLKQYDWGWDTDELFFGKMVNNYKKKDIIIKLFRGWSNGMALNRIDRSFWRYDIEKLRSGEYIDCHSLRPFSHHYDEIIKIKNNLNFLKNV